jgi:hypothetical protein
VYQGDKPHRAQLAAELPAGPEDLVMLTLDNQPLAAEGAFPTTGDALLDRVLAFCVSRGVAFPLSPKHLAALPLDLWTNAKAVENWKAGSTVAKILAHGPPDGWRSAVYRLRARRGGKNAVAWVPPGHEPCAAIAAALSVPPTDIIVLAQEAVTAPPPAKSPWIKPLSFVALLGPEEEGGVLLTEEFFDTTPSEPKTAAARLVAAPSDNPKDFV